MENNHKTWSGIHESWQLIGLSKLNATVCPILPPKGPALIWTSWGWSSSSMIIIPLTVWVQRSSKVNAISIPAPHGHQSEGTWQQGHSAHNVCHTWTGPCPRTNGPPPLPTYLTHTLPPATPPIRWIIKHLLCYCHPSPRLLRVPCHHSGGLMASNGSCRIWEGRCPNTNTQKYKYKYTTQGALWHQTVLVGFGKGDVRGK